MKFTSHKRLFIALATALTFGLLSACGGETTVADGGIRGTGSSVGPVSGFGSVFVNGVEFFTDSILNRKVISNDGLDKEGDLQKGMILRIEGKWQKNGTGQAKSMEYDDSLRGTVSGLTANSAEKRLEFNIHKQQVFADAQTVLKGKQFADFSEGDFVRVSAWRQADGRYRASYIGFNPQNYGDDPVEVEGPVDNSGSLTGTKFTMNGLSIDFSSAEFGDALSADNLNEQGAYFEVEGNFAGGVLTASRIQRDDFRRYQRRGEDMELAGPVSSDYVSRTQSFGLNGLTITVTDDTDLDEITIADLKAGVLVQVEGKFVSPTEILASEIEAREGDAEVEGNIDVPFDRSTNHFVTGGVRIHVTSRTIITDDDSDERLTINDLYPSPPEAKFISVEVSGLAKKDPSGLGYVEALQVELEQTSEKDGEYEIEATLDSIDGSDINILGLKIGTAGATFKDTSLNDLKVKLAGPGKVSLEVKYEKIPVGTGYRATEIQLD